MRPLFRPTLFLPRPNLLSRSSIPRSPFHLQSYSSIKLFTTTSPTHESDLHPTPPRSNPHRTYYETHGRAFFKCLTLAFLTYQIVYWAWLFLETSETRHEKNEAISGLKDEVRLLQEGRRQMNGQREGMTE